MDGGQAPVPGVGLIKCWGRGGAGISGALQRWSGPAHLCPMASHKLCWEEKICFSVKHPGNILNNPATGGRGWELEGKIYSSKISVLGSNKSCLGNRWIWQN